MAHGGQEALKDAETLGLCHITSKGLGVLRYRDRNYWDHWGTTKGRPAQGATNLHTSKATILKPAKRLRCERHFAVITRSESNETAMRLSTTPSQKDRKYENNHRPRSVSSHAICGHKSCTTKPQKGHQVSTCLRHPSCDVMVALSL